MWEKLSSFLKPWNNLSHGLLNSRHKEEKETEIGSQPLTNLPQIQVWDS